MINRLTLILLLFSIHVSATEVKSPINLGNYHMINKNYAIAVDHYVAALGRLPNNYKGKQYVFITEQLAIANQKLKNYNKSVFYFDQAIESELRTPNALFQYAKLLVTLKQYDKASKLFTEWGELSDNKVVAQNYTSFISSINKSDGMESKIVVTKTPWSTDAYNEFCPILHPSGSIVYTSDQPSVKNSKQNTDQSFPMNLYSVRRVDNYEFAPEVSPFFSKKSGYNRGVGCLTNDGKTIYFTGNTESKIPVFSNKPTQFNLGIFVSTYDGYRWSKPREINISNSKYNYAFPTLSEHGDTMVFSSDALGGEGAMDLFYSTNSNGEWSTPVNLGNKINTSGEEIYPRLQYDGNRHTLY
ncbi:MAG: tetratricopeptide (TPR) repeat protein, partial [bacterium]